MDQEFATLMSIACVACVFLISMLALFISTNNRDARLRNRYNLALKQAQNKFSEMWGTLRDKAKLTEKFHDSGQDMLLGVFEGEFDSSTSEVLTKFVEQAGVNAEGSLCKDLAESIEAERDEFTVAQDRIARIANEHNNLLDTFPSSLLVRNRTRLAQRFSRSKSVKTHRIGGNDKGLFDEVTNSTQA